MTRHVALLTSSYPAFSGDPSGHFVETEARQLAAQPDVARVTVVAPGAIGRSFAQGVEVVRVGGGSLFGWPGAVARASEQPARLLHLPIWGHAARQAIVRSGATEMVAHWAFPLAWPMSLCLPRDLSIDAVSHGTDVRMILRLPPLLRERTVRSISDRVRSWRFVSRALYEDLTRNLSTWTRRNVERVAQISPSPIELPDVTDAATMLRARYAETKLYVVAARLVPTKRIDAALRWLAAQPDARISRLVILGEGPERDSLARMSRELNLSVDLLGTVPREDALIWIAAADALLHPSREEGLSTVLREAAHYETTVIAIP